MKEGIFEPDDSSLKEYGYPEWFRDAKFGIWSHWGPKLSHDKVIGMQRECMSAINIIGKKKIYWRSRACLPLSYQKLRSSFRFWL
ncbi:alpha-L-fucosidase [Bacteroides sp. CR5/BHMF/2]|nr:alpha-L-fucosidase [Bacteroides sp. CR5/BHMF/2]